MAAPEGRSRVGFSLCEAAEGVRSEAPIGRGAIGAEGVEYGEGYPPPHPTRVWGSVVSSPSGVWGGAPAEIDFGAFCH